MKNLKTYKIFEGYNSQFHINELAFFVCMKGDWSCSSGNPVVNIAPLEDLSHDNIGRHSIYENEFKIAGVDPFECMEGCFEFDNPNLKKEDYILNLLDAGFIHSDEWDNMNFEYCEDNDTFYDLDKIMKKILSSEKYHIYKKNKEAKKFKI